MSSKIWFDSVFRLSRFCVLMGRIVREDEYGGGIGNMNKRRTPFTVLSRS